MYKGKRRYVLCSAVSSLLDCSKRLSLHPLADQFSQLLMSHIQLSELGHRGENKNAQTSKWQQIGLESGLSRLRIRNSTEH